MTGHVAALASALIARNFGGADVLEIGGIPVTDLAAQHGTPLYVFDAALARRSLHALHDAVDGFAEIYYSIKANPNPDVARIFVGAGCGIEIASGNEFRAAIAAGCKSQDILFAGPGKGEEELAFTLSAGIGEIHAESFEEIAILGRLARALARTVPVSLRINPIAAASGGAMRMGGKPAAFGFDEETLPDALAALASQDGVRFSGVHLFAGTQILDAATLLAQWSHGLDVAARAADLSGQALHTIDLGGGLGIPYHGADHALDLAAVKSGIAALAARKAAHPLLRDARVVLEPGRYLVGEAGMYLMRVRSVKLSRGQRFVVTDGGMHHHLAASGNLGQVIKKDFPIVAAEKLSAPAQDVATLVGPLCTPLDTLGRQTALPALAAGDLIAVLQSGAYGLTASPNGFLSHPLPREIVLNG